MRSFFLIGVFCLFSIPSTVWACSCGTPEPAVAFNGARMVFIGRMLGGTEKINLRDIDRKPYVIEAGQVRFAVEEVFKGSHVAEVSLQINGNSGTSCTYGLKRGELYVVYAYTDGKDDILFTHVCSRTKSVNRADAKADLNFLRNLPPPGSGGNIRGLVDRELKGEDGKPLSDVRVQITSSDGQVITAFTDEKGRFLVRQLKPGKYKVEPNLPLNYTSEDKFLEVDVDDRGTVDAVFVAFIDGKVKGRVMDREGNSFNSIYFELEGDGKKVSGLSTGDDGAFEVGGVPPGEYVLSIEMLHAGDSKRKPYYYPGTFLREKASVIRVGVGESVEGLQFPLPPGSIVRTIEGEVTWKDGTPAAEVDVILFCQQSSKPNGFVVDLTKRTTTDEKGRFRLEILTNESYSVRASATKIDKDKFVQMHSPPLRISTGESVKDVTLVLSNKDFSHEECEKPQTPANQK